MYPSVLLPFPLPPNAEFFHPPNPTLVLINRELLVKAGLNFLLTFPLFTLFFVKLPMCRPLCFLPNFDFFDPFREGNLLLELFIVVTEPRHLESEELLSCLVTLSSFFLIDPPPPRLQSNRIDFFSVSFGVDFIMA